MPVKQATDAGLLKLFTILDVNGDKRVSLEELRNGLRSFGFTTDQIKFQPWGQANFTASSYRLDNHG
ncbi:EF hand [Paragonimus kellicotti]|nr:EF hand [Paragonimus kellicotti]